MALRHLKVDAVLSGVRVRAGDGVHEEREALSGGRCGVALSGAADYDGLVRWWKQG